MTMQNPETSLKKRYLFKLMTNFVGLGIGLVTQAIVPRALGPSSYGNFSFLTNFFLQLMGFLNLNSSTAFYTKLSQRQDDKGLISFYFYLTMIVSAATAIFVGVSYLSGIDHVIWPEQKAIFVGLAMLWALLQTYNSTLIQVSDAYGLTAKSEVVNMLQRILGLLIIFILFIFNRLNLFSYFILQILIFVVVIAFLIILIQKFKVHLINTWRLNKIQLKSYIKEFTSFCVPLIIFSIFAIMEQMADRWFLQKFSGSMQQGFYALAYQTGAIGALFVSAMIPLIMREFAIEFANNNIERMRQLFIKYTKMLFAIAAFFGCFLAVEAKNVMLIFGGEAYTGAIIAITIMCFFPMQQASGQMNAAFFFATGRTKTYSNIGLCLFLIGLPLTIFLLGPEKYGALQSGAIGLAAKTMVMTSLSVNIQLWFNTKYLKVSFSRFLIHQFIVVSIFIVVAAGCSQAVALLFSTDHFAGHFFVAGILYTIIVSCLVWCFPWMGALKKSQISELAVQMINKMPIKFHQ